MAVISTLVVVNAGQSSNGDEVIAGGQFWVNAGGSIASTVVADGGRTDIYAGGSATGTTLQNGGGEYLDGGTAIDTLVASNGSEQTYAGGVTSGATILKGGLENIGWVLGTGLAVGMTVNGGSAVVSSGSTASGTDVLNGGVLIILNGGRDKGATVGPGGTLNVFSGGTDSGTSVTGGTMNDGGTASGTSITGGTMNVSSGGTADTASVGSGGTMNVGAVGGDAATASGVSVGSGGALNVSAGGVVTALTIKDPNDPGVTATVNVLSGGTVDGTTKIDGGQLILDAGTVLEPHAKLFIMNTGWLVLEQNTFHATIHDFGGADTLDLTKIRFIGQGPDATTATFFQANGGVLEVAQGRHIADLHLAGTYATANFALASDGAHGTLVTFVPSASLPGHS